MLDDELNRYEQILRRSHELELEIPPSRKKIKYTGPIEEKDSAPCSVLRPTYWVTNDTKEKKFPRLLSKITRQHMGELHLLPNEPSKKAASFEDSISVSHSYEAMVSLVASHMDQIDVGLALGLCEKNIEFEQLRFAVDCEFDQHQRHLDYNLFPVEQQSRQRIKSLPLV